MTPPFYDKFYLILFKFKPPQKVFLNEQSLPVYTKKALNNR